VRDVVSHVLLILGVVAALVACVGVVVMRDVYDRLHYTSPVVAAAVLVAAAIWVHFGPSLIMVKALLTAAFLLVCGPLLTHATAQAARTAEHGDWREGLGDDIDLEDR
jgi:monovalent cation/proton antiporter MnhG/PhaG subunit